MLFQMLINQPQMIGAILKNTPAWVWALLAGLMVLGFTQARDRSVGLARIMVMPVVMTGMAVWGMSSAFGASSMFGYAMLMWMLVAAVVFALIAVMTPPAGAAYDAATRTFALQGSLVPMLLILGIFLTRYYVNVEIAIAPNLTRDGQYTLVVGALYGLFSGIFAGRAARLAKMALGGQPALAG